jgi:excisionase family DNA binding protein
MQTSQELASLAPLIPVPAAAKLLGISRSAVYRYASTGDLPARRLGGRIYIVTALLVELISTADARSVA